MIVYFKEECRYNLWKIKEKPMPRGERVGGKVACYLIIDNLAGAITGSLWD